MNDVMRLNLMNCLCFLSGAQGCMRALLDATSRILTEIRLASVVFRSRFVA
ncbi:MAG: hypothetical protein JWM82_2663 [Myxococcales bacterium]|nr:hypothetical protein [Myxococcales bacterium]